MSFAQQVLSFLRLIGSRLMTLPADCWDFLSFVGEEIRNADRNRVTWTDKQLHEFRQLSHETREELAARRAKRHFWAELMTPDNGLPIIPHEGTASA